MSAGRYSFTIEQGATLDFELAYKDSNNNPINLTGYQGTNANPSLCRLRY